MESNKVKAHAEKLEKTRKGLGTMREMRSWEEWQSDENRVEALGRVDAANTAASFVRATSEETRLRTLSLYLIQSIVERHGGTVAVDLATDTINIDVPPQEEAACALEIEEQVGNLCW